MKKVLMLVLVAGFGIFMAANAWATVYTPSQSDIDTFYQVTSGTLMGPDVSPITGGGEVGPTGIFEVTISGGGWGDVQIGRDATIEGAGSAFYSGSWADLSGYSTYELLISNTSTTNDWFMANIYLNTGWTDIGETDFYYQNNWTWVAPGSTAHLVLDLATTSSSGGGGGSGHLIDNLTHVSSLGFNIGTNYGSSGVDYTGDKLTGAANPVPEPATMLLLGSGLIGLTGLKRKFRKS